MKLQGSLFTALVLVFNLGACVMEAVPPEEFSGEDNRELPNYEVFVPAFESDKFDYDGNLGVKVSEGEASFTPPSNDIGRDDSRPFDDDLTLAPTNRFYTCDTSKNYVRFVDFIRQDIVSEGDNGADKCIKKCNEHASWCTGFFYFHDLDEEYCGFLASTPDEGTAIWLKGYAHSQVCFAD